MIPVLVPPHYNLFYAGISMVYSTTLVMRKLWLLVLALLLSMCINFNKSLTIISLYTTDLT